MSEYRIKKGGREFTATRIDTLQRLAERGLLLPDDPVAVDGADYRPAGQIPDLQPLLDTAAHLQPPHDDPWRHWSDGHLDAGDSGDAGEGVLASFLDQIESGINLSSSPPGARPAPTPPPADAQPVRHVVHPEPDPQPRAPRRADIWPGKLSAVLSTPRHRSMPPEDHLPSVEAEPLDDEEPGPAQPESLDEPEPLDEHESLDEPELLDEPESLDDEPESSSAPTLSTGDPSELAGADEGESAPSMPVTFAEWLKKREQAGHESPLEGFGRYDDGIVVRKPNRREVNFFRVLLIVMIGATLIGIRWLWVKTVAEGTYPSESALLRIADPLPTGSGGLRSVDRTGPNPDSGLSSAEIARRGRERRLRSRLGGHVIEFNTEEQLEDALFLELMNRGAPPRSVDVDALRERGTQDNQHRRPTQAHLKIELAGVTGDGDDGYEQLEDRLMLAWLLVGKYQTLGKITFEDVVIRVAPPLPFERRYDGRRLAGYWDDQISAAELFLQE